MIRTTDLQWIKGTHKIGPYLVKNCTHAYMYIPILQLSPANLYTTPKIPDCWSALL